MHHRSVLFLAAAVTASGALAACGSGVAGSSFVEATRDQDGGSRSSDNGNQGLANGDGGLDQGPFTGALAFDPPEAILTLDGKSPGSAKFTLRANAAQISPDSIQFDRPDLAKMVIGSP